MSHDIEKHLDDHLAPNKRFEMALPHGTVTATGMDAESIGVSAQTIDYQRRQESGGPALPAKTVAERLVERVDYLQEPLAIIEDDREDETTQVRSRTPQAHPAGVRYYELLSRPGQVSVRRYRRSADGQREEIPVQLTRESFGRLCRDLDDASVDE